MRSVHSIHKISGYWKRLLHEYSKWSTARRELRADRTIRNWIRELQRKPPNVLLGPNYAEFGGVRGHLQAIKKYSALEIELVPPEWLISRISLYRFQKRFVHAFEQFDTSRCNAIHSHVFPDFIEWCYQQQQDRGTFWIHTYHLNYYPEHGRGGLEPWQESINSSLLSTARYADCRLSVSRWQVEELREKHGIETIYVPNGVDVEKCLNARPERFRKRHGLSDFALYVGRNDPVKNPEEFVELARRLEEGVFVMIGGGLSEESLTQLCGPLPKNLRILGAQSSDSVNDALAAAKVVVVTSKREGLPTLVLEAMVHEASLVVPEEQGCLEAVARGQFAETYCLGDVQELTAKTRKLLHQKPNANGALQHVRKHYDWKSIARHLDNLILRRSLREYTP